MKICIKCDRKIAKPTKSQKTNSELLITKNKKKAKREIATGAKNKYEISNVKIDFCGFHIQRTSHSERKKNNSTPCADFQLRDDNNASAKDKTLQDIHHLRGLSNDPAR